MSDSLSEGLNDISHPICGFPPIGTPMRNGHGQMIKVGDQVAYLEEDIDGGNSNIVASVVASLSDNHGRTWATLRNRIFMPVDLLVRTDGRYSMLHDEDLTSMAEWISKQLTDELPESPVEGPWDDAIVKPLSVSFTALHYESLSLVGLQLAKAINDHPQKQFLEPKYPPSGIACGVSNYVRVIGQWSPDQERYEYVAQVSLRTNPR